MILLIEKSTTGK